MSLFLRVETASNLLGSSSPNNTTYIALSKVTKIQSMAGEKGCFIQFGPNDERLNTDSSPDELIRNNVIDLSEFSLSELTDNS